MNATDQTAVVDDLMNYLNSSDTLMSLLYDLDLLPEQIGDDKRKNFQMLTTIAHFKSFQENLELRK